MSKNKTVQQKQKEFLADTSHVDYTHKVLEVQHLKKYFTVGTGKDRLVVRAVDDVNFDIYKREVFGLVGESGCGKTTTGRTVIRLYKATDGRVYLNGNLVIAGYQKHLDNIAKIKKEAKYKISKLEPHSAKIVAINEEKTIKVEDIQHQIQDLKFAQKEEISKLKNPLEVYKIQKYEVKKDHDLKVDNIKYQYNLEKENIESECINIYKEEYDLKVRIEKNTFENKLSGLKDSAALTKEEIELRIGRLKEENAKNLKSLEEEYTPLIAQGEQERLSRKDIGPKLQELKDKRDAQLQKEKEKFEAKSAAIVVPNHHEINEAVREVKERTAAQIASLKAEIKVVEAKAKEQVLEVKATKKEVVNKFNSKKPDNLATLKVEHEKNLKALSDKYLPLIKQESSKVLPKEAIANDLALLEEKYNKDLAKLNESDLPKDKAKKEKDKLTLSYNNSKEKLVNKTVNKYEVEYNEKKEDLVEKYNKNVKLASSYNAIYKDKASKIKADMKEKIAFERREIREIKYANRSKEAKERALEMQMIFQDPIASLNPRMTVKEIVGEGLLIKGTHTKEEIDAEVDKALELVGLSADYKTRYPHEFSGGQRQRIGIARALIMNPTFIIADEPISALDVSIRAQVINLLTQLKQELGLTILFIAHDLSVVRFFCDRIAVMYYGKIVELAPSEELFAHPMHPYTQSLLSAIPQPDPDYEKGRKRIHYNPMQHDYRRDKPTFREIANGHFVLANDKEFERAKKEYQKQKEGR